MMIYDANKSTQVIIQECQELPSKKLTSKSLSLVGIPRTTIDVEDIYCKTMGVLQKFNPRCTKNSLVIIMIQD